MDHRKGYRKIGRNSSHRKALLRSMSLSLLEKGKIETTLSYAKELRGVVEKLITLGKKGNYSKLASLIRNKEVFKKFPQIVSKYEGRKGGYTRIIKTGTRKGDGAALCIIELLDQKEEKA